VRYYLLGRNPVLLLVYRNSTTEYPSRQYYFSGIDTVIPEYAPNTDRSPSYYPKVVLTNYPKVVYPTLDNRPQNWYYPYAIHS